MTTLTLPEWTSETPTREGLYRYREGGVTWWMQVIDADGEWIAVVFGEAFELDVPSMPGEWQGPIVIDKEPRPK